MTDSPELRELRKQTSMMAHERAAKGAAAFLLIVPFIAIWLGATGWAPLVIGVVAAAVSYGAIVRQNV